MWTAARSVCVCRREPVRMGGHGWKVILRTTVLSNLSLVKVRVPE